jgi:hypothetical protein
MIIVMVVVVVVVVVMAIVGGGATGRLVRIIARRDKTMHCA